MQLVSQFCCITSCTENCLVKYTLRWTCPAHHNLQTLQEVELGSAFLYDCNNAATIFFNIVQCSKWFELRSITSLCSVIVRVSEVLKRIVGDVD